MGQAKGRSLREEREWWERAQARPGSHPARHYFAHDHVRSRLGDALRRLGAKGDSLVLEVGCGAGEDAGHVARVCPRIVGVDVSEAALRTFRGQGFSGVLGDVGVLPFRDGTFNFVVCSGLLHHLVGQGELGGYVREFARVTARGGHVLALEPNLCHPSGILTNVFNTLRPGITGLVPHERALGPGRLTRAFRRAGLNRVEYSSASYVWNRLPLAVSRFIARHEDRVRFRRPFRLFGWFTIVQGEKG